MGEKLMNHHQKLLLTLVCTLAMLGLAACCHGVPGTDATVNHKTATVHLHVNHPMGPDSNLSKTGKLTCNAVSPEGCIHVPMGDTAGITYKLTPIPGWHLSKMTICKATGADPCHLSIPQRADFAFSKDGTGPEIFPDSNGKLDLNGKFGPDLLEFVLFDNNIVTQDYTYTITACNGADCTTADPPIENGGRR